MTYAQYDTTTGAIIATNSRKVDDAALAAINRAQVQVTDNINGLGYKIDLSTLQPVALPPPPVPLPDIATQLAAAQINAGILKASDFHPETIAEMNAQLVAAGMTPIATA